MAVQSQSHEDLKELRKVVRTFPVIDNHAHNLLLASELENEPFETITTEARGWALNDTHTSLSHIRAARQLAELYGCESGADWTSILEKRKEWIEHSYDQLVRRCLAGVHSILIDDGLGGVHTRCHPYQWHSQFTPVPCKEIVRIESLAESIIEATLKEATEELITDDFLAGTWVIFTGAFEDAIKDAIADANVAGFKSVVCYRTGLGVEPEYEECLMRVGKSFERYAARCIRNKEYRIQSKAVNDFLVVKTMEILSSTAPAGEMSKPFQFHTGLGDSDMDLIRSNPAYLQPLIEQYSNVPVVLLHSSWPYTRQAAYLAAMFKHVYLDLGEAFPMLSRDGQIAVIKQAFELTPYSKLLWSTDGHFFPETYWLANKQFREVLEGILTEYVHCGELSEAQAIEAAKNIFFDNSNRLYRLDSFVPGARRPSSLSQRPKDLLGPIGTSTMLGSTFTTMKAVEGQHDPPIAVPDDQDYAVAAQRVEPSGSPATRKDKGVSSTYDVRHLEDFLGKHPVKYIYVQWLDYMGTMRSRIYLVAAFKDLIEKGSRIGISKGNVGTLQNDHLTDVVTTTGQIYVEADLRSLRPSNADDPLSPAATVFAFWRDEEGNPIDQDARGGLVTLLQELAGRYNVHPLIGFEIEVTFLRQDHSGLGNNFTPLTSNHAWSTITSEDYLVALPLLSEILDALSLAGVSVSNFHSESGPGQYELVLPPAEPLEAIDRLYTARSVIARVAARHDIRATLHPSPLNAAGNAAHAHISLNKAPVLPIPRHQQLFSIPKTDQEAFWAGVLKHLQAICAFSMPERESYARVKEDAWSGGTWVAWGEQNRECPLRRVGQSRWEVRCLDGFANMYLAMAAIFAAGLSGMEEGTQLPRDCEYNPARMTAEQREEYGIDRLLPRSIDEAMLALREDEQLQKKLANGLAKDYLTMKAEEQKMLGKMEDEQRRVWLIERY